jgi:uncharacterized protein (TIGR01777 family)
MMTILITGGTGLVGRYLCRKLIDKGYRVAILSRVSKHDAELPIYSWSIDKKETVDYIIHLAGAGIGDKRWTAKRRQVIVDSRVQSCGLLFDKIQESGIKPKAFISASATGYYGAITTDKIFSETDPPGKDFLGETCRSWEQAADRFEELGTRTVKIRTGVILAKQEGALAKISITVKLGIGSAIGTGKQYLPWIHIDDLCDIYIKAIEDTQMKGPYNAVAPDHKTNREFTASLARVLHKPFRFPDVPANAMRLLFGKMSAMLLEGSRVSSEKIIREGYIFKYPNLQDTLTDLIGKHKT